MPGLQQLALAGVDPIVAIMTLADYGESIMPLALRGLEAKTLDPYTAGWRKRVVPALGHPPVRMVTNGAVDRAVHAWIADECSPSTVKKKVDLGPYLGNTEPLRLRAAREGTDDNILTFVVFRHQASTGFGAMRAQTYYAPCPPGLMAPGPLWLSRLSGVEPDPAAPGTRAAFNRLMRSRRMRHFSRTLRIAAIIVGLPREDTNATRGARA
jgi:hypothetical protein